MSQTYVKIMSGENLPDDHHNKPFTLIPVENGYSIEFIQTPEPFVTINDLSYPATGNVYVMNQNGKTISTFTPKLHNPLTCEEPTEDLARVAESNDRYSKLNLLDLTIIGLDIGIAYTIPDKEGYYFVDGLTFATPYGNVYIDCDLVRYGEVAKLVDILAKLPITRNRVLSISELAMSPHSRNYSIHFPDITNITVLTEDQIGITPEGISVTAPGITLTNNNYDVAGELHHHKLIRLLGKGRYVIDGQFSRTVYFFDHNRDTMLYTTILN